MAEASLSQNASAQFVYRQVRRSQIQKALRIKLQLGGFVDVSAYIQALANEALWLSSGIYKIDGYKTARRWRGCTPGELLLVGVNAPYRRKSDIPKRVWDAAVKAISAAKAMGHEALAGTTIGRRLGITAEFRAEHKLWMLGACDMTMREIRKKSERERDARRRARDGSLPRYASAEQVKPWEALGVSRATYYRMKSNGKVIGETEKPADNIIRTLAAGETVSTEAKQFVSHNVSARNQSPAKPSLEATARQRSRPERVSETRWWEDGAAEDAGPTEIEVAEQLSNLRNGYSPRRYADPIELSPAWRAHLRLMSEIARRCAL